MQQRHLSSGGFREPPIPLHLGAHLRLLRDRHGLSQSEIVTHLPGWQQAAYSRIEKGTRAPLFESLPQIWRALTAAGVQPTWQDREVFLVLAQEMLESRKTRHARRSPHEWKALREQLAEIDGLPLVTGEVPVARLAQQKYGGQAPRREIGHLLGRERWLAQVVEMISRPSPAKVVVLQGPPGCGKTSELHRLARHFFHRLSRYLVVLSEPAPIQLERLEPTDILERLLGDVLEVVGSAYATMPTTSLQARVKYVLGCLAEADRPVAIFLDNAEHMFDMQGELAPIWRWFLTQFLQGNHQAVLVMASQEWPAGIFLEESQLMTTITVPRLSREEGSQLLQTLGVRNVSEELLGRMVEAVGGMPICLEWIVRLIREPLLRDEWADWEEGENERAILERLLEDSTLFGGAIARRVQPLLDRVITRLSVEATTALQDLAVAPIPLGAPALRVLYQSPKSLSELREASLLVAYPQRVQLLPMVAAQVRQGLSDDQVRAAEERLIQALRHWLNTGGLAYEREAGEVVAELSLLLLSHYRLLEAAQLLVRYGWLSFNTGQAVRLARLAHNRLEQWERLPEECRQNQTDECGKWLLHYLLSPYLGQKINRVARATDYQCLLERVIEKSVVVEPQTELFIVRHLMFYAMEQKRYTGAQALVDACEERLAPLIEGDPDLLASLLEKQGYLYTNWCEYAEEVEDAQMAQTFRERAIAVYRQSNRVLTEAAANTSLLKSSLLRKRLAKSLTNLGYHLNRVGQYEEAITVLRQSIDLKEQGYSDLGSLPASYGEFSQALAEQGHLDEALHYDELGLEHMQRLADSGDTVSQETVWIYRVNRGRLFMKVGRLTEARCLLEEAIEKIPERWEMYRMFARQALDEIKFRKGSGGSPSQYDTRWINRYRKLVSFDSFAWLASTHFTATEQEEWEHLFSQREDAEVKKRMETLLANGKQRELLAAIQEHREPQFFYPSIPLEEVRDRIRQLSALAEEIRQCEENEVVRRFYVGDPNGEAKGAIPYQIDFLRAIEATALSDNASFWRHICVISPPPTIQEMRFALSRVKWFIQRGRTLEHTRAVSKRVAQFIEQRLLLWVDDLPDTQEIRAIPAIDTSLYGKPTTGLGKREFPPETVRNLFNALFREQGYQGWEAVIDYSARNTRIEPGLRRYILAGLPYSISKLMEQVAHEWGGHVAPRVAGERSTLGLLGLGTGWSLMAEEGLGLFYELELARRTGQRVDEAKLWLGTLSTGLAAGVLVPPQTFLPLYTFLADFLLLYRLIFLGEEDMDAAQGKASAVAQTRCLRTFRGVPDLSRPGVCFPKDAVYQRGLFQIYDAVVQDPAVLDWLAAGVVALEQIDDLKALGIPPAAHFSRALLEQPDLEAYIVAFAERAPSSS